MIAFLGWEGAAILVGIGGLVTLIICIPWEEWFK